MAGFRQKLTAGIIFGVVSYALVSGAFSQPQENLISSSSIFHDLDEKGGPFGSQSINNFETVLTKNTMSSEKTTPTFQLVGTIITNQTKNAAIVSINNEQIIVTQGDYVEDYWELIRVVRGRIVIRNSDREITLRLGAQTPSTELPIVIRKKNTRPRLDYSHEVKMVYYLAGRAPEAVAFPEGLRAHGIEAISDRTFSVNVADLLDQIQRTPLQRQFDYRVDELGLRFVEIVPGGIIDHLGFLPGDTISLINDKKITEFNDLQCLLQLQERPVSVQFNRAEELITHTYFLR